MDRLRLWILGVALGSFAAGMIVGHAISGPCVHGQTVPAEDDQLPEEMAARYGLSDEQQRRVRLVLASEREQERAIFASAQLHQLPPALMNRLLAARNLTRQRIRAVLDAEQRALYDLDCAGERAGPTTRR